jgi:hypothetical protein
MTRTSPSINSYRCPSSGSASKSAAVFGSSAVGGVSAVVWLDSFVTEVDILKA